LDDSARSGPVQLDDLLGERQSDAGAPYLRVPPMSTW